MRTSNCVAMRRRGFKSMRCAAHRLTEHLVIADSLTIVPSYMAMLSSKGFPGRCA